MSSNLHYRSKMIFLKVGLILIALVSRCFASLETRRCSACKLIAHELRNRLANERVRNSIDSRSRLDKDGKRIGKVIKFEVSELRAIELLDNLCSEMKKYTLDETSQEWKIREGPETAATKHHSTSLMSTCSDFIGEWEEEISRDIRTGKATPDSVDELLCFSTGICPSKSEL